MKHGHSAATDKDFITDFNMLLATDKANEKNIFVFDETIIGAIYPPLLVVCEATNYAGGNNSVIEICDSALGSYTPFLR